MIFTFPCVKFTIYFPDISDIPLPTATGRKQLFDINMKGIKLEEGIDYAHLIAVTEGYSGADLANVCRDASMMPLRKRIADGNVEILRIREVQAEMLSVAISMSDMLKAIENVSRSVSQNQLEQYVQWMAEFGSV